MMTTASNNSLSSGGYVYAGTFSGLEADTIYKDCFTWAGGDEHTAIGTTRTWPEQEEVTEFRFMVYGDNRWDDSSATFNHRHRDVACLGILGGPRPEGAPRPALILHTGELVDSSQALEHARANDLGFLVLQRNEAVNRVSYLACFPHGYAYLPGLGTKGWRPGSGRGR